MKTETYIQCMNRLIREHLAILEDVVLFGENINNGSHISGLTKGLQIKGNGRLLNVGNCEGTHMGLGMGLMINGISSVLFAKQLDFMFLGLDQMINTYRFIQTAYDEKNLGSFTVITMICDQGWQGPQSSFNSPAAFTAINNCPCYLLNDEKSASAVLDHAFNKPGFKIICLSQSLFSKPCPKLEIESCDIEHGVFSYSDTSHDIVILCGGYCLRQGAHLKEKLEDIGTTASLYRVDSNTKVAETKYFPKLQKARIVICIDEGESTHFSVDPLIRELITDSNDREFIFAYPGVGNDYRVKANNIREQLSFEAMIEKISTIQNTNPSL